ncbi:MAG TPA: ABC transporter substrate-binding protein, partial [Chloroflexaceae bacterium]|nr:ABC transporter substrate-binding protein [Chloroflexaceae bacterium]
MTIRVLILDDEPLFGQSLVQSLALCDDPPIDAVAVVTAAEALAAAREGAGAGAPFDAFLIDQRLGPGPDGIDVLRQLLALSPRSDAVVFTIAGDREAGMRAYQAGAYRYLHKPFRAEELVLVLQTLQRMRETRFERDWLRVIAQIAEAAQRLLSLAEVQREIVMSGELLGFERTRLWLYDPEQHAMVGAAQRGRHGAADLAGFRFPADSSPYMRLLVDHAGPIVFQAQAEGPSYLVRTFGDDGYRAPIGEWVGLPLRTSVGLIGVLMLDNYEHPRRIPADQLAALTVFGSQVAVALERAQLHERRAREIAVMAEIGRLIAHSVATQPLGDLLEQIRGQVGALMSVENCFVALANPETDQLDLRLEVEGGAPRRPHSLSRRTGLVSWVVAHGAPLLLAGGEAIEQFARERRVRRRGARAQCWLGVPLTLEGQTIGAMVVQSYEDPAAYSEEDQRLLVAVAAQVAGAVHTARLAEEAELDRRRLRTLVDAGRELIGLADEDEERFWHLALTISTAGYAIGFNRAALLLLSPDGSALRGRLGIGHLKSRRARAAWRHDEARSLDLPGYRRMLAEGRLAPSDLHQQVRELELPLADNELFAAALRERRRVGVERQALGRLAPAFVSALGSHPCALLPIYAGEKRFGLLVVDNATTGMQLLPSRLDQLETWVAQVALAYENRRQHAASEGLVRHAPDLLAHAAAKPLQETLGAICEMALALTAADNAMIYPLDPEEDRFDTRRIGLAGGLLQSFDPAEPPDLAPDELRAMGPDDLRVLASIEPAALDSRQAFIRRERIRASIAAPLRRPVSGDLVGLLYLNYRNPQRFSHHELTLARNPRFYREPAKLDRARLLMGAAASNPLVLYEQGAIDVAEVPSYALARVQDASNPLSRELVSVPQLALFYLGLNVTQPPFDDPKVREAFTLLIDRARLAEVTLNGAAQPAYGVLPPGIPGYNPELPPVAADAARARALIAESRYGSPANLPPIVAYGSWATTLSEVAEEALGIGVEVRDYEDFGAYLAALERAEFQLYGSGWVADYPDPENFLDLLFRGGSGENHTA